MDQRPKRSRFERLKRLDGTVGPQSKTCRDGIDRIAICSGPHMGQIVRTQKGELTIKVTEVRQNVTYRRQFNPITGAFYFELDRTTEW